MGMEKGIHLKGKHRRIYTLIKGVCDEYTRPAFINFYRIKIISAEFGIIYKKGACFKAFESNKAFR